MKEQTNWAEIERCLVQKDAEWKVREDSLKILVDRINKKDKSAFEFVSKNSKGIALQLNDLRSALVKLAAMVIERFAEISSDMNLNYDKFIDAFLRDANVIKALGSANKVINNHAASAFRTLLTCNMVSMTALESFYNANKDNKTIVLRERIAEAVFNVISNLDSNPNKQTKSDGIDFLRKAIDVQIKDASGSVRAFAKDSKEALDNYVRFGSGNIMVKTEIKEEFKQSKKVNRPESTYKPANTIETSFEQKKTIPLPKKPKLVGMDIENAETGPMKSFKNDNSKKEIRRMNSKIGDIIDLLEDPKRQAREKIDEIQNYDLDEICTRGTFEEYKRLLKHFGTVKNAEVRQIYARLIEDISINKFMGQVLNHAELEKLDKKDSYNFFIQKIINEDLSHFLEYFMLRNNSFALKLVTMRYDADEFEEYIRTRPDVVSSLLTVICQNIVENHPEAFLKSNTSFLEHIFQSSYVATKYRNYQFSDVFFERLKMLNPDLYKFLISYRKKPDTKNEAQNIREKDLTASKTSKINEATIKHTQSGLNGYQSGSKTQPFTSQKTSYITTSQSKTETLEDVVYKMEIAVRSVSSQNIKGCAENLLKHLKGLEQSQEIQVSDGLFAKIILILKEIARTDSIEEAVASYIYKITEELLRISNNNKHHTKDILDTIFELISRQAAHKDKIAHLLVCSRLRMLFYSYLTSALTSKSSSFVIDSIKTLTLMIKNGKKAQTYLTFHKEIVSDLTNLAKIMKELFVHSEVSLRKNVVHFLVECYFFLDHSAFPKIFNEFSAEQQKLIEIYIKKAEL